MLRKDIELSRALFSLVKANPKPKAVSQMLSITTFQFIPDILPHQEADKYIDNINEELVTRLKKEGEVFVSNAIINGNYCLSACIVNFNTTYADLEILVDVVLREGESIVKEQTV